MRNPTSLEVKVVIINYTSVSESWTVATAAAGVALLATVSVRSLSVSVLSAMDTVTPPADVMLLSSFCDIEIGVAGTDIEIGVAGTDTDSTFCGVVTVGNFR